MVDATPGQRRATARLIAQTAEPVTFDEASRMIGALKREELSFRTLVEKIVAADEAGDHERLGRLLRRAKRQLRHGDWLPTLRRLGIHPRRAQRLVARRRRSGDGRNEDRC